MPNYASSIWSGMAPLPPHRRLQGDLTVDVAIVGAGITGVTAARILKRAGLRVALIEARRIGKGESGKTTAHLTEVLDTRLHRLIARFGEDGARLAVRGQRTAIDRIAALVDELSIDCRFRRVPGHLYAETSSMAGEIEAEAAAAGRLGLAVTVMAELPALPFPVARALRFEGQAQMNPRAYLAALVDGLQGDGSHVFEQTHVLDVDDSEPCRVITDSGVVSAADVIVAAHVPISNRLFVHTKLAAYRTYAVGVEMPLVDPIGLFWDTADPYHYIRSETVDGRTFLIVGGEDHKVGDNDDTTIPFKRLEAFVADRFGRQVAPTDYRWSGQIIEPADGLPYVGRNSMSSHVYIATGYGGNGITGGTLAAMILSDEIQGVANPWSDLYEATRFKPLASAKAFISENVDFPKHLVADRLSGIGAPHELDAIAPGEGKVLTIRGQRLAVYRNERGGVSAVSPVCTHLGCLVHWNTAEKSWDCPCHGSRFDPAGTVLNGPAVEPLEARPIPGDGESEGVIAIDVDEGLPA